ncbi:hypothetical protein LCGC14_1640270 [marine sediment metagenome]|uniref:Band 7 domain-containing protein n=1 Tax=marine sediment metagenome TaxID=412755 RepID=A0A0F9KZH1_9ZZZZ
MVEQTVLYAIIGFVVILFGFGVRIVRPIEKGLIETLGKYKKTAEQGFHWILPGIQKMIKVNITEQMVDVPEQTVQTSDKLNTKVDAMVYYQVKNAKASEYNVDSHRRQLTSLARTTLRAVMGNMTLTECIQSREIINSDVEKVLDKETDSYGVSVLRVEVQRIEPPKDVQEAMNNVVKAEQAKIAALDFATAAETKADGERRARIKVAEGKKQASILEAEGRSESIKKVAEAKAKEIEVVNQSIQKNFKGEAQDYKKLETAEKALQNGTKYVIDSKSNIMNVMSDAAGVPIPIKK